MISLLSDKKLNEKLENYIQREEEENKKKFYQFPFSAVIYKKRNMKLQNENVHKN